MSTELRDMFQPVPEKNCLSFWFPKVAAAGLPVPATEIVRTDCELVRLLDGEFPKGYADFMDEFQAAVEAIGGAPCFLRTGHGSGKHSWKDTCFLREATPRELQMRVVSLTEWSFTVDLVGLPTDVWVARRLLDTAPLFTCPRFGDFPVTREFRFFVRDGEVEHIQPYWPEHAVADGAPTDPEWQYKLRSASRLSGVEHSVLSGLALNANEAVPGFWSIDFLQDRDSVWWLTDMAIGERSFRYEPGAPADTEGLS